MHWQFAGRESLCETTARWHYPDVAKQVDCESAVRGSVNREIRAFGQSDLRRDWRGVCDQYR